MNRYCILTNDTEALPNRATEDHVNRLMLGQFKEGKAGVQEMASIASEFNGKITFFVDLCGAYDRKDEILEVVKWLDTHGQDVELHLHPEYLPDSFWEKEGFSRNPRFLNMYQEGDKEKLKFIFTKFAGDLESVLNRKINAYRAGSFRWNSLTLEMLKDLDIPMAFNNTVASRVLGQCPYAIPYQKPFRWSNGIIEVPVTEKNFFSRFRDNWWVRFQYPLCSLVKYRSSLGSIIPYSVSPKDEFLVCLMHSWSFLYRDKEGFQYYKDDRLQEGFRTMLKKMSQDFDIIDSRDLKYLIDSGKFQIERTEDVSKAVYVPDNIISLESLDNEAQKINEFDNVSGDTAGLSSELSDVYTDAGNDSGIDIRRIHRGPKYFFSGSFLHKNIEQEQFKGLLKFHETPSGLKITSTNKISKHMYIPLASRFMLKDFIHDERLPLYFGVDSSEEMNFGIYFYDEHGNRLSSRSLRCNRNLFLNVPKNCFFITFSFRISEGFKSAVIRFVAFSLVDTDSTHVFSLPKGLEETGNGDDNTDLSQTVGVDLRFIVKNPEKKKNGVVIVFPSLEVVTKDNVANYPFYAQRLFSVLSDDCTVIYVSEPFVNQKLLANATCFKAAGDNTVLSFIRDKVKAIIGDDYGETVCVGLGAGGFIALNFAALYGMRHCICSSLKYNCKMYSVLASVEKTINESSGLADAEFVCFPNNVHKELKNSDWMNDSKVKIQLVREKRNLIGSARMKRISTYELEYIRNSLRQKK
ncbi:hypothetical protein [Ruminobacter amylophilus]|uniref:hypothetical protein n=1 Tax=Ruminobacter amylophilus TaxID=867 RepID=UPI00386F5895